MACGIYGRRRRSDLRNVYRRILMENRGFPMDYPVAGLEAGREICRTANARATAAVRQVVLVPSRAVFRRSVLQRPGMAGVTRARRLSDPQSRRLSLIVIAKSGRMTLSGPQKLTAISGINPNRGIHDDARHSRVWNCAVAVIHSDSSGLFEIASYPVIIAVIGAHLGEYGSSRAGLEIDDKWLLTSAGNRNLGAARGKSSDGESHVIHHHGHLSGNAVSGVMGNGCQAIW